VVADEAICAGALQDRLRERFECLSRRVGASRKTRPDRTDEIRVGSWCALSQILPITPSLKPRRDKNCWSRRLKLCVSRRWQFPEFQYIAPVSLQMESRGRLLSCSSCVAFSNTALYADAVGLSPINLQASSQACTTEVPRCCCRRRYNVQRDITRKLKVFQYSSTQQSRNKASVSRKSVEQQHRLVRAGFRSLEDASPRAPASQACEPASLVTLRG
jgi:hypothetical protein